MSPKKGKSRGYRHDNNQQIINTSVSGTKGMSSDDHLKLISQLESTLSTNKNRQLEQTSYDNKGALPEHTTRSKLCSHLCEVILNDPLLTSKQDLIHRLWRGCFYPQISSFRSRCAKERTRHRKTGVVSETLKTTEKSLNSFLNEATQLYTYLATRYEAMLKEVNNKGEGIIPNFHKLLIHLGDLQRYGNDTSKAESYYVKASILAPGRGNPYNQLAVVSQQSSPQVLPKICISLYWYVRALLATFEAFDTSRSNMARLFENNKLWLKKNRPLTPPEYNLTDKNTNCELTHSNRSLCSRLFLSEFVSMHYLFFASEQNVEVIITSSDSIVSKFSKMLPQQVLGEALVMKMIVINAFSFSTAQKQRYALSFSMSFITALIKQILVNLKSSVEQKSLSSAKDDTKKKNDVINIKMLSPLLLFCEWLATIDQELLTEIEKQDSFHQNALILFWKSIADLSNHLQNIDFSTDHAASPNYVLKEHDQLRGYLPFISMIDHTPRSSYFSEGADNSLDGYLSMSDAIFSLERYKANSNSAITSDSSKCEIETKVRVQRYFSFVKKYTLVSTKTSEEKNIQFIFYDENSKKYIDLDTRRKTNSTYMDISKMLNNNTELHGNEDENDDEESDVIVYSGTESLDPQYKSKLDCGDVHYIHQDKIPKVNNLSYEAMTTHASQSSVFRENETSLAGPTAARVQFLQNATDKFIGIDAIQKHAELKRETKKTIPSSGLSLNSEFSKNSNCAKSLHITSYIKPINPPPGFNQVQEKINHECLMKNDEKNGNLLPPSNIFDSMESNSENHKSTTPRLPPPPPGFSRLTPISQISFNANKEQNFGGFIHDHFGNQSLLFTPTNTLIASQMDMKQNGSINMESRNLQRTSNPFVTPFEKKSKLIGSFPEYDNQSQPHENSYSKFDNLNATKENATNNSFISPSPQYSSSVPSWNPFL